MNTYWEIAIALAPLGLAGPAATLAAFIAFALL
jgi:hypothetical protein